MIWYIISQTNAKTGTTSYFSGLSWTTNRHNAVRFSDPVSAQSYLLVRLSGQGNVTTYDDGVPAAIPGDDVPPDDSGDPSPPVEEEDPPTDSDPPPDPAPDPEQ